MPNTMQLPPELAELGMTEEEFAQTEDMQTVIHPGEYLRDILTRLDWSASQLARALDVPRNRVTAILNEQRGISADTAVRLAQWQGTDPVTWLNLQRQYDLDMTRLAAQDDTYAGITPLPAADRVAIA